MDTNAIQINVQTRKHAKFLHELLTMNFFAVQNMTYQKKRFYLWKRKRKWHKNNFEQIKARTKELRFIYFSTEMFTIRFYWARLRIFRIMVIFYLLFCQSPLLFFIITNQTVRCSISYETYSFTKMDIKD